jgi:hypothetical protein
LPKEEAMNWKATPEQQAKYQAEMKDRAERELALSRKINTLMNGWKRCGNRVCRRAHQCVGFPLRCVVKQRKERQLTPEQEANANTASGSRLSNAAPNSPPAPSRWSRRNSS